MAVSRLLIRATAACVLSAGLFSIFLVSCKNNPAEPGKDKKLTISLSFTGPKAKGNYYSGYLPKTDWCLWIADAGNRLVKTLTVNIGVVKIGQYGSHAEHLPAWLACTKDSIKETPDADSIPPRFDGITSASVLFDASCPETTATASWDFTDETGKKVADGTYKLCAEVANIKKDSSATPPGYTVEIFSETSTGSVQYPSGTVENGASSANITSLKGTVE